MTRRTLAALAAGVAAGSLALSACGSNSLAGSGSSGGASSAGASGSVSVQKDDALAAKVPAAIKKAGVIKIGTDASYAPNEFTAADGKTIKGMDIDLFNAVAAKFGLKAEYQNAKFDSIITGVQGGKYDMGISSFTINASREKQVNMVSYYSAGTQWATAKGNPKKVDPAKPCGLTVAVQTGTTQQEDDLPPKQKACQAQGKQIKVLPYTGQDQVTATVVSGKADAMLADSPVVAYAVKQTNGKLQTAGKIYDSAPYGYVLPKKETEFAKALTDALTALEKSGDYKKVLDSWNLGQGAISNFAVNP